MAEKSFHDQITAHVMLLLPKGYCLNFFLVSGIMNCMLFWFENLSLPLMKSFDKTVAAISPRRLCFLRTSPFSVINFPVGCSCYLLWFWLFLTATNLPLKTLTWPGYTYLPLKTLTWPGFTYLPLRRCPCVLCAGFSPATASSLWTW